MGGGLRGGPRMLAGVSLPDGPHKELLLAAIAAEARGHRALLDGGPGAHAAMREAAVRYRESWEAAPPESYGRLIGALKAAVIAQDATAVAAYVRGQLPDAATSPPAAYARAVAALVCGDHATVVTATAQMCAGDGPAFVRAAAAVEALAAGDAVVYAAAVGAIVADFAQRDEHLTGVAIADTALMLELLAEPRGLRAWPDSALLPRRLAA